MSKRQALKRAIRRRILGSATKAEAEESAVMREATRFMRRSGWEARHIWPQRGGYKVESKLEDKTLSDGSRAFLTVFMNYGPDGQGRGWIIRARSGLHKTLDKISGRGRLPTPDRAAAQMDSGM